MRLDQTYENTQSVVSIFGYYHAILYSVCICRFVQEGMI